MLLAVQSIDYTTLITYIGGGLALFLFGMQRMTSALRLVAGESMKSILSRLTANRFTAAAAGILITAVIQSSSITTVLIVGLITAELLTFGQSIGVILGANVGTTITAQIVAFKISKYGLVLITLGFLAEITANRETWRQTGQAVMGLGLVLFGMELMSSATTDLRNSPFFLDWMQDLRSPILGVLIGTLITAVIQSSSATTVMVIVLAGQGLITLESGIAVVLGANIGTCVTAVLSSIGAPREASKAAAVHVIFNTAGALLWLPFIDLFADAIRNISPTASGLSGTDKLAAETPRQVANAHTLFNIANLVLFIWFTGPLAKLVERLVPQRRTTEETIAKYLDPFFLKEPSLALDNVEREIALLARDVEAMLEPALRITIKGHTAELAKAKQQDRVVDQRQGEIIKYLGKLSLHDLLEHQALRVTGYLALASYIEQIGDTIETNMVADGLKRLDKGLKPSESTLNLIRPIHVQVLEDIRALIQGLESHDLEQLQRVAGNKALIQGMADQASLHLAKRLVADEPKRRLTFQFETDTIENLKRMHTLIRRTARGLLSLIEGGQSPDVAGQSPQTAGESSIDPAPAASPETTTGANSNSTD